MNLSTLAVLCGAACQAPAQTYDLLLKGGHVIDGKNGISAIRDVAIAGGRIAAVQPDIPPARARKVVDAAGLYVTPGLVDMHVHVYAGTGQRGAYSGDNSVYPDGFTFRAGVTTVVDAGSSGWKNFPDFKDRVIDRSRTRVLAFLNIVGPGMGGKIEQSLQEMDAKAAAEQALRYKDVIVGIKSAHYAGPEWTAVDRAVEAGNIAGLPVMVDFGDFRPERPFQELVTRRLRPGDIYTHTYLGAVPMLDGDGRVLPYLFEARKRGVIFDVGHGGGSFLWRQAVPAMRQGFKPDSISTDLHIGSMNSGMKDMLNLMSKFLTMGMPLEEVVQRSTWTPAQEIRRTGLGHLSVGAPADVALLRLRTGEFGFVDVYGARLRGTRKLECEMTILEGRIVWDLNGMAREDWETLPPGYTAQGNGIWDGVISPGLRSRKN
ncbi:MAG: amidohydrolase/deacetylase family metallohydrolase [Bryobacteraceae bacterium]